MVQSFIGYPHPGSSRRHFGSRSQTLLKAGYIRYEPFAYWESPLILLKSWFFSEAPIAKGDCAAGNAIDAEPTVHLNKD